MLQSGFIKSRLFSVDAFAKIILSHSLLILNQRNKCEWNLKSFYLNALNRKKLHSSLLTTFISQSLCSSPRVMLPQKNRLVVNEFTALCTDNFTSELFTLQEIEEVETHWVLDEFSEIWLLPIEEVLEIVYEVWVFKVVTLSENCGMKGN